MAEWLKILVSAVVGMIAGLVADPLRELVSKRVRIFRVRRALGFDWLTAKAGYAAAEAGATTKGQLWQWDMFQSFTYYWQHDPGIFYSDLDLQLLRLRIQALQILQDAVKNGRISVDDADLNLKEALNDVEQYVIHPPKNWLDSGKRKFLGKFY